MADAGGQLRVYLEVRSIVLQRESSTAAKGTLNSWVSGEEARDSGLSAAYPKAGSASSTLTVSLKFSSPGLLGFWGPLMGLCVLAGEGNQKRPCLQEDPAAGQGAEGKC